MADLSPPVIVLGGDSNALSIARSLGGLGVAVYGLGLAPFVARSRHVQTIPLPAGGTPEEKWTAALLGPATEHLRGAVVLSASDVGITVLNLNRAALAERFLLDICDVQAQQTLLDKLATYESARAAGVPTPLFWRLDEPADLERVLDDLVFPLILKPLQGHIYRERFPGVSKFRRAADVEELRREYAELTAAGISVMLVEQITEPDDQLCSYYTYLDDTGTPTFDFTKRVIRRNPPGMGIGSYHITDRNPEVQDLSLQLFKHVGLRGLANAEFIRDSRDGKLKLIECNARFTAANPLVAAAGLDLAQHVYLRIIGQRHELPIAYTTGLRLLYPSDDFRSFLALRRSGELTFGGWLRSIAHRQTFAYARWDDPGPAVFRALLRVPKILGRLTGRRPSGSGS